MISLSKLLPLAAPLLVLPSLASEGEIDSLSPQGTDRVGLTFASPLFDFPQPTREGPSGAFPVTSILVGRGSSGDDHDGEASLPGSGGERASVFGGSLPCDPLRCQQHFSVRGGQPLHMTYVTQTHDRFRLTDGDDSTAVWGGIFNCYYPFRWSHLLPRYNFPDPLTSHGYVYLENVRVRASAAFDPLSFGPVTGTLDHMPSLGLLPGVNTVSVQISPPPVRRTTEILFFCHWAPYGLTRTAAHFGQVSTHQVTVTVLPSGSVPVPSEGENGGGSEPESPTPPEPVDNPDEPARLFTSLTPCPDTLTQYCVSFGTPRSPITAGNQRSQRANVMNVGSSTSRLDVTLSHPSRDFFTIAGDLLPGNVVLAGGSGQFVEVAFTAPVDPATATHCNPASTSGVYRCEATARLTHRDPSDPMPGTTTNAVKLIGFTRLPPEMMIYADAEQTAAGVRGGRAIVDHLDLGRVEAISEATANRDQHYETIIVQNTGLSPLRLTSVTLNPSRGAELRQRCRKWQPRPPPYEPCDRVWNLDPEDTLHIALSGRMRAGEHSARLVIAGNAGTADILVAISAGADFEIIVNGETTAGGEPILLGPSTLAASGHMDPHNPRRFASPIPAEQAISLRNLDASLSLQADATLQDADDGWRLNRPDADTARTGDDALSIRVPPGTESAFHVIFAPDDDGQYEAVLRISHNGKHYEPVVRFPLQGESIRPAAEAAFATKRPALAPDETIIDFGGVMLGDTRIAVLGVRNAGPEASELDIDVPFVEICPVRPLATVPRRSFGASCPSFTAVNDPTNSFRIYPAYSGLGEPVGAVESPRPFPIELASGRADELVMRFQPREIGAFEASVRVLTSDPDKPEQRYRLLGRGTQLPEPPVLERGTRVYEPVELNTALTRSYHAFAEALRAYLSDGSAAPMVWMDLAKYLNREDGILIRRIQNLAEISTLAVHFAESRFQDCVPSRASAEVCETALRTAARYVHLPYIDQPLIPNPAYVDYNTDLVRANRLLELTLQLLTDAHAMSQPLQEALVPGKLNLLQPPRDPSSQAGARFIYQLWKDFPALSQRLQNLAESVTTADYAAYRTTAAAHLRFLRAVNNAASPEPGPVRFASDDRGFLSAAFKAYVRGRQLSKEAFENPALTTAEAEALLDRSQAQVAYANKLLAWWHQLIVQRRLFDSHPKLFAKTDVYLLPLEPGPFGPPYATGVVGHGLPAELRPNWGDIFSRVGVEEAASAGALTPTTIRFLGRPPLPLRGSPYWGTLNDLIDDNLTTGVFETFPVFRPPTCYRFAEHARAPSTFSEGAEIFLNVLGWRGRRNTFINAANALVDPTRRLTLDGVGAIFANGCDAVETAYAAELSAPDKAAHRLALSLCKDTQATVVSAVGSGASPLSPLSLFTLGVKMTAATYEALAEVNTLLPCWPNCQPRVIGSNLCR